MIWITSDHHFGHKNIIKYAGRPFESVEEMDTVMKNQWNLMVKVFDIVIHLGDFALTSKTRRSEIRNSLKGTIILIGGASHDHSKYKMSREGFIVADDKIIIDDLIFTHEPLEIVPHDKWNVHGHIHEKDTTGRRVNVCVEKTNYRPINFAQLRWHIEKRKKGGEIK